MPRRRRSFRRRRRRFRGRRGPSAMRLARRALAHIDTSVKYKDFLPGTLAPFFNNPVTIVLNGMAEGTEHDERIGNAIKLRSIQGRMLVTQSVAENVLIRYLLVWDKQPQSNAPVDLDQILMATGGINSLTSPRNLDFNRRFILLWTRDTHLDPNSRNQRLVKFFIKFSGTTRYSIPIDGPQAITQGSLVLYLISSGSQANRTNTDVFFRLRYVG